MNDDQIHALKDRQKADVIRRAFGTKDGKLALRILELHFGCHLPSAPQAGFIANQTFYFDGHKAVTAEIREIIAGKWSEDVPDPLQEIEIEDTQS